LEELSVEAGSEEEALEEVRPTMWKLVKKAVDEGFCEVVEERRREVVLRCREELDSERMETVVVEIELRRAQG